MLKIYTEEIKTLTNTIARKDLLLKKEKENLLEICNERIGLEDMLVAVQIHVAKGFALSIHTEGEDNLDVTVVLGQQGVLCTDADGRMIAIPFEEVARTSLLADETESFRIHIRMYNNSHYDLIHTERAPAASLYKFMYLMLKNYKM
jgi:hypothetical protein